MSLNIRFAGPPGPEGKVSTDLAALEANVVAKTAEAGGYATTAGTAKAGAETARDAAIAAAASVPSPATQAEVDAASAAKGVLANKLGPIYSRMSYLEERGGYAGEGMRAPYYQPFDGGPAAITTLTGWSAQFATGGNSGQLTALTFGNGSAGGDGNAYSAIGASYDASAMTGDLWVTRVCNIAVGGSRTDHFAITASAMTTFRATVSQSVSSGLKTGIYTFQYRVSGGTYTTPTNGQIGGLRVEDWDSVTHRYATSGGTTTVSVYLNGRMVGLPITVSGLGVAFTNKFGFLGDTPSQAIDEMRIGSATTDAMISLYQPNRIVQQLWDGVSLTATWYLRGEYTKLPPAIMYYTLYDKSSGSWVAVTGHTDAQMSSLLASAGTWSGQFTVNAAVIATGGPYRVRVYRKSVYNPLTGTADVSSAVGPLQRIGDGVVWSGQSLGVGASRETLNTVITSAEPATSQFVDGEPGTGNTATHHEHPMTANTNQSYFAAVMATLNGGMPVVYASGGLSNTTVAVRGPGSPTYLALVAAIYRSAAYDGYVVWVDGQSNTGTPGQTGQQQQDTYYNDMVTTWTALRLVFPRLKCLLIPMAGQWTTAGSSSDALDHHIHIAQYRLVTDLPAIFVWGPHMMDLQHADNLHSKTETVVGELGYGEFNRRVAYALAKLRGYSGVTNNRNGPTIASVTKIDAQTLDVTYNLNGFDSIDLINSAVNSEYHGGMMFATATTFLSPIYPSGFTVNPTITSGQQKIRFTFPTNTFPGTAYARAVYGSNPFNPTNITAVNTDVQGKASMIVGVKAGEPNVSLQPYVTLTSYLSS